MSDKIKIGILGCASVAERYAIDAFQSIENAEVISIASRDYAKAKQWAARFGIAAEKSYEALLANRAIDAVYIPLPIGLHEAWVIKAANAGKHIICEKSLAHDLQSAMRIVKTCTSKGLVLYENYACDFHPQHQKVMSLIEGGNIGTPFVFQSFFGFPPFEKDNIRYDATLGASGLYDAGGYPVLLARRVFNAEPIAVACNLGYDKKGSVDLRGSALLEFPGGRSALFAFSYDAAYQNNYSVWGSQGIIKVERAYSIPPNMRPDITVIKNDRTTNTAVKVKVPPANHFEMIFRDFCDTILHQKTKAKKIRAVYAAIIAQARVLEALRVAAKEKRVVHLDYRETLRVA